MACMHAEEARSSDDLEPRAQAAKAVKAISFVRSASIKEHGMKF